MLRPDSHPELSLRERARGGILDGRSAAVRGAKHLPINALVIPNLYGQMLRPYEDCICVVRLLPRKGEVQAVVGGGGER